MSKSYRNAINLSDSPEIIKEKCGRMFTDPLRVKKTDPGHPEKCNVFTYHKLFNVADRVETISNDCQTAQLGCTDCKAEIGEVLTKMLTPITVKRNELLERPAALKLVIEESSQKANTIAHKTITEFREALFA
jgi:tryptophanyl-tRNA synthetase